jgi:hypothetical protein
VEIPFTASVLNGCPYLTVTSNHSPVGWSGELLLSFANTAILGFSQSLYNFKLDPIYNAASSSSFIVFCVFTGRGDMFTEPLPSNGFLHGKFSGLVSQY